jgi:hypothetical protein
LDVLVRIDVELQRSPTVDRLRWALVLEKGVGKVCKRGDAHDTTPTSLAKRRQQPLS